MTDLTIYDPALCCPTGICGAEVDQKLVDFASDLDWLKSRGVEVRRINLSQEPSLFAENEQVKSVLEKTGVEGLPVIFAGDTLQSSGQYPTRATLAQMVDLTYEESASPSQTETKSSGCCGGSGTDNQKQTSGCC